MSLPSQPRIISTRKTFSPWLLLSIATLAVVTALAILITAPVSAATPYEHSPVGNARPAIGQWMLVPPVTTTTLKDVEMVSTNLGWAVGDGGVVLKYDGTQWQQIDIGTTDDLIDIIMLGPTNGYILGRSVDGGQIFHFNGTDWPLEYTAPSELTRLHASAADNVWGVGLNLTVHWDGSQWSVVSIPVQRQLFGVWALSATDVWSVGQYEPVSGSGLILHYTNGQWIQVSSPAPQTLFDCFFLAPDDGWTVGYDVNIYHYDGVQWSFAYTNTFQLSRLFMLSHTEGWAISSITTAIAYFNGSSWTQVDNPGPLGTYPEGISMISPLEGWIVGDQGLLLHYLDTSTPTPTITPTATDTYTSTPTGTSTPTPSPSATPTASPSATSIPSSSPTATATAVHTSTATPTATATSTTMPTASPSSTPCSVSFSDVHTSDYFYEPVRYLACNGAISGYSDNTFRPYNNTTRGQLSKIVVLAEGWSIDTTGGPHFTDVPSDNPFYSYIETAYHHAVISGYADSTFRWGNNVTRGQLSKIIVVAQGWGIDTTGGPHFTDVPTTDPFYSYIETAYHHRIISGYADRTFRPGSNATRGQISKIVYNAVTSSRP